MGASFDGVDQTERFIENGIWENGYDDKYLSQVRSIRPGDRIAIKASYTRKHDLPFNNRGNHVSVMAIKAIGTVTHNHQDGRVVDVDWRVPDAPREWYFYTQRGTIWRPNPDDWMTRNLVAFSFDDVPQDIDRFLNEPYWRERYGRRTETPETNRFPWTAFYQAIADRLLHYKSNRTQLITGLNALSDQFDIVTTGTDKLDDDTRVPLEDICPFTVMAFFNRGISEANRRAIAREYASFLGVTEPVPESFDGIPIVNNQATWFFGYQKARQPDDIDALWSIFEAGLHYADSGDPEARDAFIAAYDNASSRYMVGWRLTIGLYWIRPWTFPTLDSNSRKYITKKLGIEIGTSGANNRSNGSDYLSLADTLEQRFLENSYPIHSFPELSLTAWTYEDGGSATPSGPSNAIVPDESYTPTTVEPYTVDSILADGAFLDRQQLLSMLERLKIKKNLILQGPPGTGKTWLAKRLAFALMGKRDEKRLRAVQFHPNLSYEDFVRGWRPSGQGTLALIDGPFLQMIEAAVNDSSTYVVVIEEINRGNPAQILGEMLTLLDADKRTPAEALELSYRRDSHERVHVPANLYVIGTMNLADRSLALVDLALRRRFAFVDLQPVFGAPWRDWVHDHYNIDKDTLKDIEVRINALNKEIADDPSLGVQYAIGHSYVTPMLGNEIKDGRLWFRSIVHTEIRPLLEEYWFDYPDRVEKAVKSLISEF